MRSVIQRHIPSISVNSRSDVFCFDSPFSILIILNMIILTWKSQVFMFLLNSNSYPLIGSYALWSHWFVWTQLANKTALVDLPLGGVACLRVVSTFVSHFTWWGPTRPKHSLNKVCCKYWRVCPFFIEEPMNASSCTASLPGFDTVGGMRDRSRRDTLLKHFKHSYNNPAPLFNIFWPSKVICQVGVKFSGR